MAKTIGSIATQVLYRLGDSSQEIWSADEISGYIRDGYADIAARTRCFFEMAYLEDSATTANLTGECELDYLESGEQFVGLFNYTEPFEQEWVSPGELQFGPSNHTALFEYDNGYVDTPYFQATHRLPDDLIQIERSTWNRQRIEPVSPQELEYADARYRLNNGEPIGYIQDQDGVKYFRKWKVPSVAAPEYTVTGNWGAMRDPTDIADETIIGTWGIPRRLPGKFGIGLWGFPRRAYKSASNTKIEYIRHGTAVDRPADTLELPDRYCKYLRHYAMASALERNGDGQDSELAAFWRGLYEASIGMVMKRKNTQNQRRTVQLGGATQQMKSPPLARLPWNYGKVVG
jgi:hypothetical protein